MGTTPWILLEHIDYGAKVPALKEYVRKHANKSTMLLPKAPVRRSPYNKGWTLHVNADVKAELWSCTIYSLNGGHTRRRSSSCQVEQDLVISRALVEIF